MSFQSLLDSTCTIKRLDESTKDAIGGYTDTSYAVLYRRVKCRFENFPKRQEIMAYAGVNTFPEFYVYISSLSGIKEGDFIYKGNRQFEITLIEDWSMQGRYMRLSVTELTRGKL